MTGEQIDFAADLAVQRINVMFRRAQIEVDLWEPAPCPSWWRDTERRRRAA